VRILEACNDHEEPVHRRSVAPTLVKSLSGAHLLRDAHGVRTLKGREVAALHGYATRTIGALTGDEEEMCGIIRGDGVRGDTTRCSVGRRTH